MLTYKRAWLVLWIFQLAFASLANSQSVETKISPLKVTPFKKKWKVIDGFRSAKFGMSEKKVIRAIAKDFKISEEKVERQFPAKERTTVLTIHVPSLMKLGGPADIFYILGYKSKRLIQINIDWGKGVSDSFSSKDLVALANILRNHFTKKRYKPNGYVVNKKINDNSVIVFRGQNKKGRGIILHLESGKKEKKIEADKSYSLFLSYISDIKNPDIFSSKSK
jgi:hypothetical protein